MKRIRTPEQLEKHRTAEKDRRRRRKAEKLEAERRREKHNRGQRDRRRERKAEKLEAGQRQRTAELVGAVRMGVRVYGLEAARLVVPSFAELHSIPELAEAMNVNRSALWQMLGFHRSQAKTNVRRILETHLDLSPGGMTEVMSLIETLVTEDAQ